MQHPKQSDNAFVKWCQACGAAPLPAEPATIAAYLKALAGKLSHGALARRLAAVTDQHRQNNLASPIRDPAVKAILRDARRGATRWRTPSPRPAQVAAQLACMAAACPGDLAGLRDRALLLLAAGGLGRATLVGLDFEHVRFTDRAVELTLPDGDTERRLAIPCGRGHRAAPRHPLRRRPERLSGPRAAPLAAYVGDQIRTGVPKNRSLGQRRTSPSRHRCHPPNSGQAGQGFAGESPWQAGGAGPDSPPRAAQPDSQRDMTRSAAAKATEAADALLHWLRTQPRAVFSESPTNAPSAQNFGDEAGPGAVPTGPSPVAAESATPGPIERLNPDDFGFEPRAARAPGPDKPANGAPLRLAHTDWLHHRLTISGPQAEVAAFRKRAAGAGIIPWHLDLDRLEEDLFHRLVAPPSPQNRTLSLAGARIVAGQLREAVAQRQKLAVTRVGRSRACPFDLHALLPVPEAVIQLGPDHPESLAWLWQHWGTTQALRHVTDIAAGADDIRRPEPAQAAMSVKFWSADWTPWRALAQIAKTWPALHFATRPTYDRS